LRERKRRKERSQRRIRGTHIKQAKGNDVQETVGGAKSKEGHLRGIPKGKRDTQETPRKKKKSREQSTERTTGGKTICLVNNGNICLRLEREKTEQ